MPQQETLLHLDNVCVGYKTLTGTVKAVVNATMDLTAGDTLGIVGESGSGKSTLAHGILRLLPKNAEVTGKIEFAGIDLLGCGEKKLKELRWKDMAVVFQKSMNSLSPVHRIGDQLLDIYRVHVPDASKDEVYDRMRALFSVVNLPDRVLELYPQQLSGGMLQRICISMSLMHQPKLVIFDEATTALDVVTQGQVLKEIRRLQDDLRVTSILITHDVSVVAATCKRVAVMYAGYVVEMGSVEEVLVDPWHPYTKGLLGSFPSLVGERRRLSGIPGTLPDLKAEQKGCVFAPRCSRAMDVCQCQIPHTRQIQAGRIVRCHLEESGHL